MSQPYELLQIIEPETERRCGVAWVRWQDREFRVPYSTKIPAWNRTMSQDGPRPDKCRFSQSEHDEMFRLWVEAGCRPPGAPMTDAEIEAANRVIDRWAAGDET